MKTQDGLMAPRADAWPFISIRHPATMHHSPETFGILAECHARHPGACDEFWFATANRPTQEALAAEARAIAALRPLCEKAGVKLSFQQGVTLGHGALDGPILHGPGIQEFPDDAWQMDRDGKRIDVLCPRSQFVLDYERECVKTLVAVADPSSYWLDDDLRLGIRKPKGCFCPRCIAAFNAKTGGTWTREALVARLFGDSPREQVRAQWIDFNAESLAIYAAAARRAIDELGSRCRLAYQAVWADAIYTGRDFKPLLEALSGPGRASVGIRPGAEFWNESAPRGMVEKCLAVAREAERCRDFAPVASVCYEQETYPRHLLNKSPGAIMTECALALASGCNALSLYWFPAEEPVPVGEYDRFLDALLRARPYFERLAASTSQTRLGGVARFVGPAAGESRGFTLRDPADYDLACAGIPVTVAESNPKVFYITEKSRAEMPSGDGAGQESGAPFSAVDITGFGQFPLASRRTRLLDDLDAATGGAFPVRIDECRALRILPRVLPDGRLDSVTLLNLSIGDTDELSVRVRNPAADTTALLDVKGAPPRPLPVSPGSLPGERVVHLDNIPGWQICTVFFGSDR